MHMDNTLKFYILFQQIPLIYSWRTDIKNDIFNNFRLLDVNLEFPVRDVFVCGVITHRPPLPPRHTDIFTTGLSLLAK